MSKFYCIELMFIFLCSTVSAEKLFPQLKFDSLIIITEGQSVFLDTDRKSTRWTSTSFDFKNDRLSQRWVNQKVKPIQFENADSDLLFLNGFQYHFMHSLKRAIVQRPEPKHFGNFLTGYYHGEINLFEHIQNLPEEQFLLNEGGIKSFWIDDGHTLPTEYFVNEQNRISKSQMYKPNSKPGEENEIVMITEFQWVEHSEFSFWYPSYSESKTYELSELSVISKSWTRDLIFNPELPEKLFEVEYPEEYEIFSR